MKIVYIIDSIIPSRTANSIHVMKMCRAFSENGHEVILLIPESDRLCEPGVDDIFSFYGVDRCFEVVRLACPYIKGRGAFHGVRAVLQKAVSLKPDLLYTRNIAAALTGSICGLPVVFESHTLLENIEKWLFCRLIQSNRLERLVVISNSLARYYGEKYPFIKKKIRIVPDGADPVSKGIKPLKSIGKNNGFAIGYVGHLYDGKGIDLIAELSRKTKEWADFYIVGGTESDLRKWRQRTVRLENFHLLGFQRPCDVEQFRLSCDILIAPYQRRVSATGGGDIAKWMSPLKLFEYMAAGKPIVCSDLPVLQEVLVHGHNALLCSPEKVDEWVHAIESLKNDEALRNKLGCNALKDFMQNYTWKSRARRAIQGMTQ